MRTVAGVAPSEERPSSGLANGWLDPQHLEFVGCDPLPVTREEIEGPEWEGRRVEYWHAATETAWVAREGATPFHEALPSALARILERVAMFRGSPIDCMGSTDLRFHTPEGELLGFIQADQLVYLRPERTALLDAGEMVVGTSRFPDVVLEVDNTTDPQKPAAALRAGRISRGLGGSPGPPIPGRAPEPAIGSDDPYAGQRRVSGIRGESGVSGLDGSRDPHGPERARDVF